MKKLLLIASAFLFTIGASAQFVGVEVEEFAVHTGMVGDVDLTGYTTYRVYVNMTNPSDFLSAVFSEPDKPMRVETTTSFYQDAFGSLVGSEVNPGLYGPFPALEYDSWVTIGRSNTTSPGGQIGVIQSSTDPWIDQFNAGESFVMDGLFGGSWYTLNTPENVNGQAGADLKVLVGQFTTDGVFGGTLTLQVFPLGLGANEEIIISYPFSSNPDAIFGCTDPAADNFDPAADTNDFSCIFPCAIELTNVVLTPNDCPGGNSALVLLETSGAQGATTFRLNGGNPQLSPVYGNLSAGEYELVISDTEGCEITETIEVIDPDPIQMDLTVSSSISCAGEADAVITAATSGGTGEVLYGTSPEELSTLIPEFSGLGAGSYTVYAMDENGCTASSNEVLIGEPAALNIVLVLPGAATCFNTEDGTLTVTANGGTGQLSYSSNGTDFTTSNVLDVTPGMYTVYVEDENGCSIQSAAQFTVAGGTAITLDSESVTTSCADSEDGSVSFTADGGNGGFTYSFNGGDFGAMTMFEDLAGGMYPVMVMDAEGCQLSEMVEVDAPDAIMAAGTANSVSCFGESNGMIELSAMGGTGEYMYSFDGSDFGSDAIFIDLTPGTYAFQVMDENGCLGDGEAEVMEPDAIDASVEVMAALCNGSEDGELVVNATGGTGMYMYSLDGGDLVAENTFSGLAPGSYTVQVEDENGCANSVDADVTEPDAIEAVVTVTEDSGAGDGTITIEVTGGSGTYSFEWTGPNDFSSAEQNLTDLEGGLGDYSVVITDENDCTGSADATVTVGVSELLASLVIGVSPNPSTGDFVLNIDGVAGEKLGLTVLDGLGRTIINEQISANGPIRKDINLNAYANGMYFLNLTIGQEVKTVKLIKQ